MLKAGMGPGYDDHSPESDTYLQLSSLHSPELYLTEMHIVKPGCKTEMPIVKTSLTNRKLR